MIPNVDLWNDYRRNGKVFIASFRTYPVGANSTSDILIRVPEDSSISILIQAEINDYMDFYIYENPILNNVGHSLIVRNMNRAYSDDTNVQFSHSPDINDVGSEIIREFGIAWFGYFNEGTAIWEFKKDTNYLLRIRNISGEDSFLTWRLVYRKITGN